MFEAGYGTIGESATETRTFEDRQEAQAWINEIVLSLPAPTVIEHEADEEHEEAWTEEVCSWHAWVKNLNA